MNIPTRLLASLCCAIALLCLFACASGRQKAQALAQAAHFRFERFETPSYVLDGWLKEGQGQVLHVYLEGDGLAFVAPTRPSPDPTPRDPVALRLAIHHPGLGTVLYLARPCQYVEEGDRKNCQAAVWTSARMSQETLDSMSAALDTAKVMTKTTKLALYGYSGGGGIAALLAQQRCDVIFLGTIAGNLDHRLWTSQLGLTPLRASLNPMDGAFKTAHIPQLHLSGAQDSVIPAVMAKNWCAALPPDSICKQQLIPAMPHEGPWEHFWPSLLRQNFTGGAL